MVVVSLAKECPISDEMTEVLMTASRHRYFESIRREHQNDGLIFETLDMAVGVAAEQVPQCDCVAHERLKLKELSDDERESLKVIIRSDSMLTADAGCGYVCTLLRILFAQIGMTQFRAERCGQDFGVSYVLLCENTKYSFRGYPDFVVHKDDIGAGRILVATGDIQSIRHADIQNSIYGVGCLAGQFYVYQFLKTKQLNFLLDLEKMKQSRDTKSL